MLIPPSPWQHFKQCCHICCLAEHFKFQLSIGEVSTTPLKAATTASLQTTNGYGSKPFGFDLGLPKPNAEKNLGADGYDAAAQLHFKVRGGLSHHWPSLGC